MALSELNRLPSYSKPLSSTFTTMVWFLKSFLMRLPGKGRRASWFGATSVVAAGSSGILLRRRATLSSIRTRIAGSHAMASACCCADSGNPRASGPADAKRVSGADVPRSRPDAPAEDLAVHLLQATDTGALQQVQIRLDLDLVGLCHSAFSNRQLLFMKARNGGLIKVIGRGLVRVRSHPKHRRVPPVCGGQQRSDLRECFLGGLVLKAHRSSSREAGAGTCGCGGPTSSGRVGTGRLRHPPRVSLCGPPAVW